MPKITQNFTQNCQTEVNEICRRIWRCLKRDQDIGRKTVLRDVKTASTFTPAISCSRLVLGYVKIQSNTKCRALLPLNYETHSIVSSRCLQDKCSKEPTDLLSHGLRICYGGTKVPVPLQSAVQPRPVIVSVSRMREAPRYKSVKLAVSGITWLAFCA